MHLPGLVLVLACTVWTLLGALSVAIVTRRRSLPFRDAPPPLTVLKPLCGAEPSLEATLESFFRQDYPAYEILFGVEDANDPAAAVAKQLIERHPERSAKLVVHGVRSGTNPKVRNLRGMIPHATFDLVVVSDSNIRAPEHYLRELVDEYRRGSDGAALGPRGADLGSGGVGLVTSLVRGAGEDGLGAALESVQLAGFCAAGIAGPSLVGEALVMGKSMLFSQSRLEDLGGLPCLANVLAEDYVMGKMFQHGGYAVRVAPTVVENLTTGATLGSFVARQRRWAMLRSRLRPLSYVLEPITSPLAMLPFAWALLGPWAIAWAVLLLLVRDVVQWLIVDGTRRVWMPLALAPLREALSLWVWIRAPFCRHITWRKHRVRLSSGSLAYAARGVSSGP